MCVIGIVGGIVGVVGIVAAHGDYSDYSNYSNHSDYSDAAEKQRIQKELLQQEVKSLRGQLAQDIVSDLSLFQRQNNLPARFSQEANKFAAIVQRGADDTSLDESHQSLVKIVENHYTSELDAELSEKMEQLKRVDSLIKRVNEIRLEI